MNPELRELDLLRGEHRFFLLPATGEELLVALRREWMEIRFSDRPCVRTIYLESDEHEVPFGTSVKLRQFSTIPSGLVLPTWGQFRFEVKSTRRETERTKTVPRLLSWEEATQEARVILGTPTLRPYLAVEYERQHFVPQDGAPLRFTVDRGVRYWFFEASAEYAEPLGGEEILRLEAKVPIGGGEHPAWVALRRILSAYGALPINSKRNEGFARIGQHLVRCFGLGIERDSPGFEIEAKLLVHHEDPLALFQQIKGWMRRETTPILLPEHFPFTIDAETVNQYWSEEAADGRVVDGLKVLLRGDQFGSVEKDDTEVLDAECGIVKRRERKSQSLPYHPEEYQRVVARWSAQARSPRFLGHLTRWRRAIWPVEQASQRVYHVSIDRCAAVRRAAPLWQVEIEYVGRIAVMPRTGQTQETEVIADIQHLVRCLLTCANREQRTLEPTTLTKFQWLAGS